jgi:short-subunit dehydrogenase
MKKSAVSMDLPVLMVTGCNSGIGLALAKLLYKRPDYRVVITARGKSLAALKGIFEENDRFLMRELDIINDKNIATLTAEIFETWRAVDVLINNAGICYRSVVEHMDEEAELHQLRTNYLGPMSLIRAVVPAMRERGKGHIVNVSSVSGMFAMPTMGSYSASKAALQSASEALWYELRPFGVKVSIIQPGFVHSRSAQNVYYSKKAVLSEALEAPYSLYYVSFSEFVSRLMTLSQATPERIAAKILRTVQKRAPPLWVPVTADAHLFKFLRHILPQSLFHHLMFKMLPNPLAWTPQAPTIPSLPSLLGKP